MEENGIFDKRLAAIEENQKELIELVKGGEGKKTKDEWDRLSIVAPILSALLISGVGLIINSSLDKQRQQTQKIEVLEKCISHLTSPSGAELEVTLMSIEQLSDPDVAIDVASLYPGQISRVMLDRLSHQAITLDQKHLLSIAYTAKGKAELKSHQFNEAESCFTSANNLHANADLEHFNGLLNLADAYSGEKRKEQALSTIKQAQELFAQIPDKSLNDEISNRSTLAIAYDTAGDLDRCMETLDDLIKFDEKNAGPNAATTITAIANKGNLYTRHGQAAKGEPIIRKAVDLLQTAPLDPCGIWVNERLATCLAFQGKLDEAATFYQQGVDYRNRVGGAPDGTDKEILTNFARLREKQGLRQEASVLQGKANAITTL
jgi:tetratricopeptide (TPR) repeat protein